MVRPLSPGWQPQSRVTAGDVMGQLQTTAPQKRLGARSLHNPPRPPFRAGKVRVALFESRQRDVPKSCFFCLGTSAKDET
jgi:hypothetical protein